MSGKAFRDCTTADLFRFDPDRVRIDTTGALADGRTALPVLESLVLDIMARGVIEPIVVRKDDDGEPIVVDGRQRTKAAQEAARRLAAMGSDKVIKIPAVYRNEDDLGAYAAMISANEHRQDDDPIEKARKVQHYINLGGTEADAAVAFGVTTQTIRNWLKMLNAGPEVAAAVKGKKIGRTAASEIATLPKSEQPAALERATQATTPDKKPTVRQTKAAIHGDAPPSPRRMRGRAEIELVMSHHPAELEKMSAVTALRWVLGNIEIEELAVK